MDNQAYLDQISAKPIKAASAPDFLHSKFLYIILGGIVAFILIMLLGAVMNSGENTQTKCEKLYLHTENLSQIINDFQPSIKSSQLRSDSTSFHSILSNVALINTNFLTKNYDFKKNNINGKLKTNEDELYAELNNDLFDAKINGLLDRTYARKMAHEVAIIRTYIKDIVSKTKDQDFKNELSRFNDSLDVLENAFDSFSETKTTINTHLYQPVESVE